MSSIWERYESHGVIVEIIQDSDPIGNPMTDQDNAGIIYSWVDRREFEGDEAIHAPDSEITCPRCDGSGEEENAPDADPGTDSPCARCGGSGYVAVSLIEYMATEYDAALTIPLFYSGGSYSSRLYETSEDDANCVICFTQAEIDSEWSGRVRKGDDETGYPGAEEYARARVEELDNWLQGYTFGIVIKERTSDEIDPSNDKHGEVLESVWGFIGNPDDESGAYIRAEAESMAKAGAEAIEHERELREEAAARDIITVDR